MSKRSFKNFVEQELGSFPQFVIYTILEWILITTLFINGLLAFLSNQYARFFDLNTPCLLCNRIDHVLVPRDPQFYYNDSICDSQKKKVSSLAYCHVHKKLSEIKYMCEGSYTKILSFSLTMNETFPWHSRKRIILFGQQVWLIARQATTTLFVLWRVVEDKTSFLAPAPSPRVSELKDADVDRTPSFVRGGNKFFGIPLSDSVQNRPRWSVRSLRKSSLDKTDMADSNGETILNQLKKEVRLDKKSLLDLYMELDEERSASAVAANNAMTMITRLQAEKSSIQMEALHELAKREEEMKELEAELEAYRERYGCLTNDGASREEFLEEHGNSSADYDCQEAKPVNETVFCFSNHAENIDQNGSCKESSVLVQMESSEESTSEKGNVSKEDIVKELSEITEKLSALQSNGELSKHMADVLDVSEGEAILLQISQTAS
ncbi:hypothetical protein Bca4012_027884 [Brassica carinata]